MGGVKERGWNWVRFFLAMGYRGASEARANAGEAGGEGGSKP